MRSLWFAWSAAAVVAVMAGACGEIPAAGDDDTSDAAPTPDGPPPTGIAELHVVLGDGTPVPGADVVFTRPDGTVIMGTKTDVGGRAGTTITEGDLAWVQFTEGAAVDKTIKLFTIAYLQVGDDVRVGDVSSNPPNLGTISVSLPGAVANAQSYRIDNGCESQNVTDPSKPITMGLSSRCMDTMQRFNVTAAALDGNQKVLAATSLTNLQFPAASMLTLPAFGQPITVNFAIQNIPANAGGVGVQSQFFRTGIKDTFNGGNFDVPLVPPVTTFAQALKYPAGFMQSFAWSAFTQLGTQASPLGFVILAERVAGEPKDVVIDLATAFPGVSQVVATIGTGEGSFAWVESQPLDSPASKAMHAGDAARFAVSTSAVGDDYLWSVIAPASVTSPFVLKVPTAFQGTFDAIRAVPEANKSAVIQYLEVDQINGYKAVKATAGTQLLDDEGPPGDTYKAKASFSGGK